MKKIIIALAISLIGVTAVHAATIWAPASTKFRRNEHKRFPLYTITAQTDGEITAKYGINLILDPIGKILWNNTNVFAYGTAADNGRVNATITPTFLDDYKVLHINVKSDFLAGEVLDLSQLSARAYDKTLRRRYIGLDINGDLIADTSAGAHYEIIQDEDNDRTPPYPITNLKYTVNYKKTQITLNWVNPPDYDMVSNIVERSITKNGQVGPNAVISSLSTITSYTDNSVQPTDIVTYTIFATDRKNFGKKTTITINLNTYMPPSPAIPKTTAEPTNKQSQPTSESESDELSRLFNYFNVRYQIKCKPSGIAPPEGSSACLWAKINLLYAQNILTRSDVNLSLSERERYLIQLRLPFAIKRLQKSCITASEPAIYCTSLQKAINRAKYLLEKNN